MPSQPASRVMSACTAAYAVYCFVKPDHLPDALEYDASDREAGRQLAHFFGARDLTLGTMGVLGSPEAVRTAMTVRIAMDIGDGILLSSRASSSTVRSKVLAVTLGYGALNLAALLRDRRS